MVVINMFLLLFQQWTPFQYGIIAKAGGGQQLKQKAAEEDRETNVPWYPGYGYYHYFNDYAYPYYGYGPWGFWPRKTAKAAKPVSAEMVNLNGIANEQDLSGLLNRNVALAMPDDVPASEPTKFASAQRPVISPPDHSS
ncbi:hypothetical protein T4B_12643 [Trichinella pseudospiralis]|uniref:Uncharacterized protein n=2 Tax=Trichinella pseudospiralis TaxID=6337 RepID=A0A0V1IN74_TRIPS|nr:hypothetical protein T4D_6723 [Trichinella pseudospiralis]KRZ24023.1 hypothetical protein T4B_12643 [Trichinella pseudospiralis]